MSNSSLAFHFKKNIEADVLLDFRQNVLPDVASYFTDLSPDKIFVVCDSNVERLYGSSLVKQLQKVYPTFLLVHSPDEASKNLQTLSELSDSFFSHGGTSRSCICALGGGITGNIGGLLSVIVYRGIKLVHIPTTLLAQLDSAADVKQSVNAPQVKNAIGAYKAPDRVIIDSTMLSTLPEREILSGLGEAIKHGFSQDLKLVDRILGVQTTDINTLEYITQRTIELKVEHWANTPTIWNDHKKIERLTHLGHTTGKILEMVSVDYLTHGEAISHGMVIEAYASHALGLLDLKSVKFIQTALHKRGLLFPLDDSYNTDVIVEKLYANNAMSIFALLRELGNPITESTTIDKDIIRHSLQKYFEWLKTITTAVKKD